MASQRQPWKQAVDDRLSAVENELDLIRRLIEKEHRYSWDDLIAFLEHERVRDEWDGFLSDNEEPSNKTLCFTISGTMETVHDRNAGVSAADGAYWLWGKKTSTDRVAAVARCFGRAYERGLLVYISRRTSKRYRLAAHD